MILPIISYEHNILRKKCREVDKDIYEFGQLIKDMWVTLDFANGTGLAMVIFNIKQSTKVVYLNYEDAEFELFVNNNTNPPAFQHICLQRKDTEEIYKKAVSKRYWTYIHKKGDNETYFIKDKMNNIFELKQ